MPQERGFAAVSPYYIITQRGGGASEETPATVNWRSSVINALITSKAERLASKAHCAPLACAYLTPRLLSAEKVLWWAHEGPLEFNRQREGSSIIRSSRKVRLQVRLGVLLAEGPANVGESRGESRKRLRLLQFVLLVEVLDESGGLGVSTPLVPTAARRRATEANPCCWYYVGGGLGTTPPQDDGDAPGARAILAIAQYDHLAKVFVLGLRRARRETSFHRSHIRVSQSSGGEKPRRVA